MQRCRGLGAVRRSCSSTQECRLCGLRGKIDDEWVSSSRPAGAFPSSQSERGCVLVLTWLYLPRLGDKVVARTCCLR